MFHHTPQARCLGAACAGLGALLSLACTGQIDQGTHTVDEGDPAASPAIPGSPRPGPAVKAPSGLPAGDPAAAKPGPTGPTDPSSAAACGTPQPGPSPLRRLTSREYNNTLRDLVGTNSGLGSDPTTNGKGFDNDVTKLGADRVLVQAIGDSADQAAARMVADLTTTLGCDPAARGEDTCARGFFDTFGARAWRRPLDAGEMTYVVDAYARFKGQYGFSDAVRLMIQYFLQSPRFFYRTEFGVAAKPGEAAVRLTPYETASRLSYLLWETMPDTALFQAARNGELDTREQVAAQARRMLKDPRARQAVAHFNAEWLQLDALDGLDRSKTVFPTYSTALNPLYRGEIERFLEDVIWQGKGDFGTLLTASHTFLNDKLAAFYGIKGQFTADFKRVELDPTQRPGLLTRGGLMAILAHGETTSPVKRGVFTLGEILCAPPPPPPPNVDAASAQKRTGATMRAQLAMHQVDPSCTGCHRLIDPVGLGFESFDAAGLWRTTEAGQPVDVSGEVIGTDVAGKFTGAAELVQRLAGSRQAADCLATHWFRFAHGRAETDADACTLSALQKGFAAAGTNIVELIVAVTQTDAFLYRSAGGTP